MEPATAILLGGALFFGYQVFGKKSSPAKTTITTTTTTGGDCVDKASDCVALVACASPILAKATAADTVALTKMISKASGLGCTGLVDQISKTLAGFGLGGGGVKTTLPDGTAKYSIVHDIGLVPGAASGDMLIVALTDAAKSAKYITPLIYSLVGSRLMGVYEKTLANIAVDKFKEKAGPFMSMFGEGIIVMGPPPDLDNGSSFDLSLAGFASPGDVVATVTAAQMKSASLAATSVPTSSFAMAGEGLTTLPRSFGGDFGVAKAGRRFGGRAQFNRPL